MSRPECGSCRSSSKHGKLLKCLHSLCVECLEKYISGKGSVGCPECGTTTPPPPLAGVPLLQYLPDSDVSSDEVGEEVAVASAGRKKLCDECAEDIAAVAVCMDCGDNFCTDHAKGHPTSRRSYKHKVVPLSEAAEYTGDRTSASQYKCSFHSSFVQCSYCLSCEQLVCKQCVSSGDHAAHNVQTITDASSSIRQSLKAKLTSTSYGSGSVFDESIKKSEAALSGLRDETEGLSSRINDVFGGLKKAIENRQQELLDEVDRLQLSHLLPLEEQNRQILAGASYSKKVQHLAENCNEDVNFLKMSGWLEEAAKNAMSASERDVKGFAPGTLLFSPCHVEELTAAIARTGVVSDIGMLSSEKSSMTTAASVEEGDDLTVIIEPRNGHGDSLAVTEAHLSAVHVDVTSADNTTDTIQPVLPTVSSPNEGANMIAPYKTTGKRGSVQISAMIGGNHVAGSPAMVTIVDPLWFDPSQCHADLALSNNNRTVTRGATSNGNWRSVCGARKWSSGKHEISLRLDRITAGKVHHVFFLCNAQPPRLDSWQTGKTTSFGWYGYTTSGGGGSWTGGALGQPWQAGDVIQMSLDCENLTLVGRHERTGATETLTNVTGELYLYISLYSSGDQVTIL
ncbi:E3 ubiquitin-protein ligase TRIM56-like [Sycon ciliatum]|uniref:E3 ubiquitin-protein ligase TRIM56-like n=1 Tax=Sycon ciliatum TaxID=27933 RepID=UPI0031F6414D